MDVDIAQLIHSYGYAALAVGTLLEGETVLLVASVAAREGYLDPVSVLAVAAACGFAGDQFWFLLGRRGSKRLRRGPWLAAAATRVDCLMRRFDWLAVPAIRFLYGIRIAGPIVIGMGRIDWRRFLWLNLAGAVLWSAAIGGAGLAGAAIADRAVAAAPLYPLVLAAAVPLAAAIAYRRRTRSHSCHAGGAAASAAARALPKQNGRLPDGGRQIAPTRPDRRPG